LEVTMAEPTSQRQEPTEDEERAAVSIDAGRLNDEFVRVSSDLAYWNRSYAGAVKRLRLAEMDREGQEASLRLKYRAEAEASGQKITEGTLDALVVDSPQYKLALTVEVDSEHDKNRATGVVDAIRTKRDMLVSLGAHIRAEMQRDPSIRETEKR